MIQYRFTFAGKTCLNTGLYTYCTICGKINERFKENKSIVKDYIREVNSPIGKCKCYSRISDEELYEKYHNKLPVFFVGDIYKEKYVDCHKIIIQMENKTIGTSYMYQNETINQKHYVPKSTNNNQTKN